MNIKINMLFIVLVNLFTITSLMAQINATTDDGKPVTLKSDGTWEYKQALDNSLSYVFIGQKRLSAGQTEVIHNSIEKTSVTICKDENKKMIIFWQESSNSNMNLFDVHWVGDVILYLQNGQAIKLIDRNINGQNILEDKKTYISTNTYQCYAGYYLTESECKLLTTSMLVSVAYSTNAPWENGTTHIDVQKNNFTLRDQLKSLGF